jgi:hypothetical protein
VRVVEPAQRAVHHVGAEALAHVYIATAPL